MIALGVESLLKYFCAEFAFFTLPIVNPIFKIVIKKIITVLINYTELGAYFIYVDNFTQEQAAKFQEAAQKNKEAQANGTDEQKKIAEQELIARARDLVKYSR